MFETVRANNHARVLPMVAGFSVVSGLLFAVWGLAAVAVPGLRFTALRSSFTVTHLVLPARKGIRPSRRATTGAPSSVAAPASLTARPGTPAWFAHVEHGRDVSFEIYAEQSLPVLRANGITLAMDTGRPRGITCLFDLATQSYARGPTPDNVVLRELVDLPPNPDIDEGRLRAERELGAEVRVFALYPIDLYRALRSYTEEALRGCRS